MPTYEAGPIGQGVNLTPAAGSAAYLSGNPLVTSDTAFTIAAWVKPNSISGINALVYQRTSGGGEVPGCTGNAYNFGIAIYNGQWLFQVSTLGVSGCSHGSIFGPSPTAGKFYHVAGVYDKAASKVLFYIDGVLVGQQAVGPNFRLTPSMVTTIGNQPWAVPPQPANSTIDDLRVYNSALSAAEISTLVSSGLTSVPAASFGVNTSFPNGSLFTVPADAARCQFDVSGTWSEQFNNTNVGPTGFPGQVNANGKIPGSLRGSLLVRRVAGGAYTRVGNQLQLSVIPSDTLAFSVDEGLDPTAYVNNVGSLTVNWICGPAGTLNGRFTKVSNSGALLQDSAIRGYGLSDWGCTRNNTMSVIYEIKMDSGLRSRSLLYTNFTSTIGLQNIDVNGIPVPATQANIDDASNSIGHIKSLNAQNLCGRSNWRLPNSAEGSFYPVFTSDASFFPDVTQIGGVDGGIPWYTFDGANVWLGSDAAI